MSQNTEDYITMVLFISQELSIFLFFSVYLK